MSNAAKLKKKAAEFEAKKQLDKALVLYRQILDDADPSDPDVDVGLFNRVGDLLLRQGAVADAVNYYEKAVDLYAEGGFFNNAIALCNKILRQSPGRSSIYYKLGKISAKKGFTTDAKQNFLEYADRMQKAGQLDEAFRALKEFADLCPDQDDIRLMLAEQLAKRERKGEAMEQLQTLYERLEQEGRDSEARATLDRMKAIDPEVQPPKSAAEGKPAKKGSDLVFLDVDYDTGPPRRPAPRATVKLPEPAVDTASASAIADLPLLDVSTPPSAADGPADEPLDPAEFGAMRLGTPMDTPAVERPAAHDLALPGELPDLDMSDEPVEDDDLTLDGLVPPIGRSTREQPTLGTAGLDIQRGTSHVGGDDLLVEPTTFGDASSNGRDVSPLAGFEQTALDDDMPMLDLAGDEQMLDLPDDIGGDDMLVIDDAPPARDDRATRRLTPGEIARADAAARGGAVLDDDLLQLPGDPGTDDGFSFLEVPDEPSRGGTASFLDTSAPGASGKAARLGAQVEAQPDNWELRRTWAEALLEAGDREGGLAQLDATMVGAERSGDLDLARSVADEVIRVDRDSVRHHQKRVEYAFRTADRSRLVDAYLELADSLFRMGQPDKAKVVYQRVLELAPDDLRAGAAISSISGDVAGVPPRPAAPAAPVRTSTGIGRRYTGDSGRAATPPEKVASVAPAAPPKPRSAPPARPPAKPAAAPRPAQQPVAASLGDDASFVNLGDLLRADDMPKNTRMIVAEEEPTGDEQADFADMLRKFKQGVSENVDEEDYESHYDLGVAYKEMGLLDEAIAEFQKALRGPSRRVRTYEALGQCFLEKKQWQVAATILQRADAEPGEGDEQLVGVLYLLGYAMEALQKHQEALMYYQRVFAVDIQFRDVGERLNAVEKVAR